MRLLLFNLATDADDPILGFTTQWIGALAARVEFVHVITMRVGRLAVPENVQVHSIGKEKGYSEPRRVWEFFRILIRVLREDRVDVCFSHMNPLFTVLAGPILKYKKLPIFTWYAHAKVTWILKLAHRLSNRMVSSLASSYGYRHDKFAAIGQGIDTDLFHPIINFEHSGCPTILCVGRLSPVKGHVTLLEAVRRLRTISSQPFRVVILGAAATDLDEQYVGSLHRMTTEFGLEGVVNFEPAVPITELPDWYRQASVYVNMTPTGSADKVVWEAMACGTVTIVANPGFSETLGTFATDCIYESGNSERLAERLKWALSLTASQRAEIGQYLRKRVEAMHGLARLANQLVNMFEAAISTNGSRRGVMANSDTLRPRDA